MIQKLSISGASLEPYDCGTPEMRNTSISRRNLLKGAVAAPIFIPASVLGFDGPPPSDRVRIGLIGLGQRADRLVSHVLGHVREMQIAAICDCLPARLDAFQAEHGAGRDWKQFGDFREMIEWEKLDGVAVVTTTHARAWIACHAMSMGQDVYIEKPMCLTVEEGRHMVKVARKYERVTQVGTQQRTEPINQWAGELVRDGLIGKVKTVLAPNFMGPLDWPSSPAQKMPQGMDAAAWNVWTNQAEMRPYHADIQLDWMY